MASVVLPHGAINYGPDILPKYQKLKGDLESGVYRRYYRAEVRWMDRQFGRIVRALDELDLRSNTLVIFTADHGESLGEHGYHFQHGAMVYEPTANVPLAFRLPGRIEAGRRIDTNVSLVDLFPTLAEGLGLPDAPATDGRSLRNLLHGGRDAETPSFVVSGWGRAKAVAVRRGSFKLVHTPSLVAAAEPTGEAPPGWKLFDLQSDPDELLDASLAHPEIRDELQSILLAWAADRNKPAAALPTARPTPLPSDLAERLRRLGYLDE